MLYTLGLSRSSCATMAKHWSVTSLVVLVLLGCLALPGIEAQHFGAPLVQTPPLAIQTHNNQQVKGAQKTTQTHQFTPVQTVWQQTSQTPQYTQVQTVRQQTSQTPQFTKVQQPQQKTTQTHQFTPVQTVRQQTSQTPQFTKVQEPQKTTQTYQFTKVQEPQQKTTQTHQFTRVQEPQKKAPQFHQKTWTQDPRQRIQFRQTQGVSQVQAQNQSPHSQQYGPRSFPAIQSPQEPEASKPQVYPLPQIDPPEQLPQPSKPQVYPLPQISPPEQLPQYQTYQPERQYQPTQTHQAKPQQVTDTYQPGGTKQHSYHSCEVAESQRVPCGGSDISAAACEAIGCCFYGQRCYFGKAVTVQCTKDAQFIVIVARDATLPNIDLESISLLGQGQGCAHVDSNAEFAIYQFPVTSCGSIVMEEPGVIIYENRMTSSFEVGVGRRGVITRDSHFELLFQCRYIGTAIETVVVEVLPIQEPPLNVAALGPIRVHLRLANGECNAKGCNELDMAYTSFYSEGDYPVRKVLRDPVYVEVQLLEKTDPNLVLTLGRCWTTTSANPHDLPQWDILIDGCPYRDDRYLSTLVPVGPSSGLQFPSHFRRFIFKMFTFVNPNSMQPMKEHVYIHCSTAVCTAAAGHSCEPSCFRKRRDVSSDTESTETHSTEPKVVVSVGPLSIEGLAS